MAYGRGRADARSQGLGAVHHRPRRDHRLVLLDDHLRDVRRLAGRRAAKRRCESCFCGLRSRSRPGRRRCALRRRRVFSCTSLILIGASEARHAKHLHPGCRPLLRSEALRPSSCARRREEAPHLRAWDETGYLRDLGILLALSTRLLHVKRR